MILKGVIEVLRQVRLLLLDLVYVHYMSMIKPVINIYVWLLAQIRINIDSKKQQN